jgi:basic membrane lipoprotein Med (substrate-binding protein (PBP1-ABC) superfamily)
MRIRRAILPAILALGLAGSALTGVTAATAATSVLSMHYHGHVTIHPMTSMHYHG